MQGRIPRVFFPYSIYYNDIPIKVLGSVPVEAGEDDFKWFCEHGLAANIGLVKDEFCKERGLKPFKVCIVGKPYTGKSFYAK